MLIINIFNPIFTPVEKCNVVFSSCSHLELGCSESAWKSTTATASTCCSTTIHQLFLMTIHPGCFRKTTDIRYVYICTKYMQIYIYINNNNNNKEKGIFVSCDMWRHIPDLNAAKLTAGKRIKYCTRYGICFSSCSRNYVVYRQKTEWNSWANTTDIKHGWSFAYTNPITQYHCRCHCATSLWHAVQY